MRPSKQQEPLPGLLLPLMLLLQLLLICGGEVVTSAAGGQVEEAATSHSVSSSPFVIKGSSSSSSSPSPSINTKAQSHREDSFEASEHVRRDLDAKWPGLLHGAGGPPAPWVLQPFPTSWRLAQGVLSKAARGEQVRIAAVGGSITQGGGGGIVDGDRVGVSRTYAAVLGERLKEVFPDATITVTTGARGGTGSATTGFCLKELAGQEVDLMLIDYALNDFPHYGNNTTPFENLLRTAVAEYPGAAFMVMGFWAQNFKFDRPLYGLHEDLAAHYDMGFAAMQSLASYLVSENSDAQRIILNDHQHASKEFHALMGDLLFLSVMSAGVPSQDAVAVSSTASSGSIGIMRSPRRALHEGVASIRRGPPHWELPRPMNTQLQEADAPYRGSLRCDIAGLPKVSGEAELEHLSEVHDWSYVPVGFQRPERTDRQLFLIPDKETDRGAGQYLVADVEVEKHIMLAECGKIQPLDIKSKGCGKYVADQMPGQPQDVPFPVGGMTRQQGAPFRVFLNDTGAEVHLEPWMPRQSELWVSTGAVPSGRYRIRIEPQAHWCPYSCLGAVIGI